MQTITPLPTRPKEGSNGICTTGDVMLGLCLFFACAASPGIVDDRYSLTFRRDEGFIVIFRRGTSC